MLAFFIKLMLDSISFSSARIEVSLAQLVHISQLVHIISVHLFSLIVCIFTIIGKLFANCAHFDSESNFTCFMSS